MDMVLSTLTVEPAGAFSYLKDALGTQVAVTCEHTYDTDDGRQRVKLPPGEYVCVRGRHQLSSGPPFVTFEVTEVPGHSGILFHPGNEELDSDGCILLGSSIGVVKGLKAVMNSIATFEHFMSVQEGVESFRITVERPLYAGVDGPVYG